MGNPSPYHCKSCVYVKFRSLVEVLVLTTIFCILSLTRSQKEVCPGDPKFFTLKSVYDASILTCGFYIVLWVGRKWLTLRMSHELF